MTDKIVLDIETKNTFADVGRDNFDALEISLVGAYSYNQNKYFCFNENQLDKFAQLCQSANLLIGFSINRFDLPVLKKYLTFDLLKITSFDILDKIEIITGQRVGLNSLAKTNLGVGKTGYSLEAPLLYHKGQIEELKSYCLNDVKITKELYELAIKQGYLLVPQKNSSVSTKVGLA